ncbi:MAG TPA: hypothetical protein VNA12_03900 [Mycobacteriales bacterium]|nr:hypothetical protein [Mycobacteriales bacterium]
MRVRSVRTVALAAVIAGAGAGHAAPKRSCNLVVDPAGDVRNTVNGVPVPNDPGLDLLGGDIATNAEFVTAVIRLATEPEPPTVYARTYLVQVNAGLRRPLILAFDIGVDGTRYSWGYADSTVYNYRGRATGRFDGRTAHITARLADIAADESLGAIKAGATMKGISLFSFRRVTSHTGVHGFVFSADDAFGKPSATYRAGAPSCIKVG